MNKESEHKYKGKSASIADKYKFLELLSKSKEELIVLVKKLYRLQEENERHIAKQEKQLKKNEADIDSINEKLSVFYDNTENLQKYIAYKTDWLYIDKIVFVLERTRKPMTSKQITGVLLKIEPELKLRLLDPFKSITKSIYNGVKINRVLRHSKTGNFGYTYLLPEWINEKGILQIEH